MIYIDTPRNGWSHMVSSNLEELHNFATSIGIKRCWFQNKKGKNQPHYDVKSSLYRKTIQKGAITISRVQLLMLLKQSFGNA